MTRLDSPHRGFFRIKLVKGGPWVPAAICRPCCCTVAGGEGSEPHEWTPACDRFPSLSCFVNGVENPDRLNTVWIFGKPIDEAEYRYMVDAAAWDRAYAPDAPAANPAQPVDLNSMDPIF